jgi:lipid II:glycine glycyltransferase (peptidoglycan interpeptide bridge formation enzyme)
MDKMPSGWDTQQIKQSASFLQSAGWANFQAKLGTKPHFLVGDGWSCLLLEKQNRIGKYLYSQYGPTVDSRKALDSALQYLTNYGRKFGAAWISLEPMSENLSADEVRLSLRRFGAKPAARHREPELTRVIDLSSSPDELLSGVSQSTRSLIRKNQREKFLSFKTSINPKDISIFTQMLGVISKRKNIYFYSDDYFKKQAEALMPSGMMFLELAYDSNQPVASAVFHDFGQTCSYTFAGSLPKARQTSASALLLWQAMLNAKNRGITKMDLYGIAPAGAPASHPWSGFTSFKQKFGGQVVEYAGAWDIPLNPRYRLYRGAHRARQIIKRH